MWQHCSSDHNQGYSEHSGCQCDTEAQKRRTELVGQKQRSLWGNSGPGRNGRTT